MKENRLIIVLAALLLIVLGTVAYLLSSGKLTSSIPYETSIRNLQVQSDSDEAGAIEKDLAETEFDDIDEELDDIEAEINAGY